MGHMSVTMPKNVKEERLRWVKPIEDGEMRLCDIAKVCPHSKRSLERWCKVYREHDEAGLQPRSTRPKTQPNETPIRIKERVLELRKEKHQCAQKIAWDLEEEGIRIDVRTIGKILKVEGLTRKYRVRRITYKYVKALLQPGELMEIDVKYVPHKLSGRRYFQYTAIDVASRWRYLQVFDEQAKHHAVKFLSEVRKRFSHQIKAIKTDNHSIFTNRYLGAHKSHSPYPRLHFLDAYCKQHNIEHYLIDPGKPAQNGTVERSHRTDQEHFYDRVTFHSVNELKLKLRLWNMYYNDTRNIGLNGQTPNQALTLTTPPYVYT